MEKNMIRCVFVAILYFTTIIRSEIGSNENKATVMVLGTIHGVHYNNPNYNFDHIIQIIETYNPEVICVEIRPQDFRKVLYLTEMVSATIYGLKRNIKVYPIDWWPENTGLSRDAYMKTDEYKEKEKIEVSKEKESIVIQSFNNKYGDWKNYSSIQGFDFWNNEDYNKYWEEVYRISMEVYGDGPINLYYETRNNKMLGMIKNVVAENSGKKIMVLTGSEHKHYFDKSLSKENNVELLQLKGILPLNNYVQDDDVIAFIKENKAKYYFDISTQQGKDNFFHGQLTQLVHGMDMDFKPEIIPIENIRKAKLVIDEWKKTDTNSIGLAFELGWYNFLSDNYSKAIGYLEKTINNLDLFYINTLSASVYRTLGFCYDLLGKREIAIDWYRRGEKFAEKNNLPRFVKEKYFKNYKDVPYKK
jgi:hypothetical protein